MITKPDVLLKRKVTFTVADLKAALDKVNDTATVDLRGLDVDMTLSVAEQTEIAMAIGEMTACVHTIGSSSSRIGPHGIPCIACEVSGLAPVLERIMARRVLGLVLKAPDE